MEVIQKIFYVDKESGFSVVMLYYAKCHLCQKHLQSTHHYINDNQEFLQFLKT